MIRMWCRRASEIDRSTEDVNVFISQELRAGRRVVETIVRMENESASDQSFSREPWVFVLIRTE